MDRSVQCVGMEISALLNHNVEEVFVQLFVLARLPTAARGYLPTELTSPPLARASAPPD